MKHRKALKRNVGVHVSWIKEQVHDELLKEIQKAIMDPLCAQLFRQIFINFVKATD